MKWAIMPPHTHNSGSQSEQSDSKHNSMDSIPLSFLINVRSFTPLNLTVFCFHETRHFLLNTHISPAPIQLSICICLAHVSAPFGSLKKHQVTILLFSVLFMSPELMCLFHDVEIFLANPCTLFILFTCAIIF